MRKVVFLLIYVFFVSTMASAQDDRRDRLGIGLGPSILYGDNTGKRLEFKFKVMPVLAVDYSKKISAFFDVKATAGFQMINSGFFYSENELIRMAEANQPYATKGSLIFGDIMPVYHINPNQSGYLPSLVKVYTGLGLGYFNSIREDTRRSYTETGYTDETYDASNSGLYIPYRLGVFKELERSNAEIGVEGSLLFSLGQQMDGNSKQHKMIKQDVAMQLQFYYRINIGR